MYTVKKIKGINCVLRDLKRNVWQKDSYRNYVVRMPEPNFAGTGLALAGVLKEGQTLEEWMQEHIETENAREGAIYE
jgi:hypothetical protein